MTREEILNLAEELIERMEVAKKEAQNIRMNEMDDGFYFVHCGDKEYVNPKYLSFEHHCQIVQLCKMIKEHSRIEDKDLFEILKMNKSRFEFLQDVYKSIPNLVEMARGNSDEKFIPYMYMGNKFNVKEPDKTID